MIFLGTPMVLDLDRPANARRIWIGVLDWLSGERDRWALWFPVAFALGVAIYFALDQEPPPWPAD